MTLQTSTLGTSRSTVNLVRSSHSWTEAESAAGFVLRYLSPMRRQLAIALGSNKEADQALKVLLTHLVSAGFGEHQNGKLRDFLALAVRSCAKSRLAESGGEQDAKEKLATLSQDSKQWRLLWRDCLLDRAWRALERMEHQNPSRPLYSVLWNSTVKPDLSDKDLITLIQEQSGTQVSQPDLEGLKLESKASFAQLLADEVVETLQNADKTTVKHEIRALGIGGAFSGLTV